MKHANTEQAVNYDGDGRVISRDDDDLQSDAEAADASPQATSVATTVPTTTAQRRKKQQQNLDSDTDFRADSSEESDKELIQPFHREDFDLESYGPRPPKASTIAAQMQASSIAAIVPTSARDTGVSVEQILPRQEEAQLVDDTRMDVDDDNDAHARYSLAMQKRKPEGMCLYQLLLLSLTLSSILETSNRQLLRFPTI
jgi:hypothetical protein